MNPSRPGVEPITTMPCGRRAAVQGGRIRAAVPHDRLCYASLLGASVAPRRRRSSAAGAASPLRSGPTLLVILSHCEERGERE